MEVEGWRRRVWGESFLIPLGAVANTGRHVRVTYLGVRDTQTAAFDFDLLHIFVVRYKNVHAALAMATSSVSATPPAIEIYYRIGNDSTPQNYHDFFACTPLTMGGAGHHYPSSGSFWALLYSSLLGFTPISPPLLFSWHLTMSVSLLTPLLLGLA